MRAIRALPDAAPEHVATTRDWIGACGVAHAMLCLGQAHAHPGEPWVAAIGRTAGGLLASRGYGLAEGASARPWAIQRTWVDALRSIAAQGSTAADGCVQVGNARVPIERVPRGL